MRIFVFSHHLCWRCFLMIYFSVNKAQPPPCPFLRPEKNTFDLTRESSEVKGKKVRFSFFFDDVPSKKEGAKRTKGGKKSKTKRKDIKRDQRDKAKDEEQVWETNLSSWIFPWMAKWGGLRKLQFYWFFRRAFVCARSHWRSPPTHPLGKGKTFSAHFLKQ